MTQQIADTFITSDGPTSGAVVYGYLASRFTVPPELNSMPPGSYGADAGPVTTGPEWGGPGEFRMDLPTNEPYYLSFTYNGQVSWKFYGAALLTVGGRGVITLSANLDGNDKRATGFHDAVFPTDLATYQQVQLAQGSQGPQGSQGAQGDPSTVPGPQGVQGNQGFQGDAGPQGTQGFQGNDGAQGFQGYQGDQGPQGFQGTAGTNGNQGAQGSQGFQGATGSGAQGAQGTQGATGSQGLAGGPDSYTNLDYSIYKGTTSPIPPWVGTIRNAEAWTVPPELANINSATSLTPGVLYCWLFRPPVSFTPTHVQFRVGASITTAVNGYIGVYGFGSGGNPIFKTGNHGTDLNTGGMKDWSFVSPTALTAGNLYASGMVYTRTGSGSVGLSGLSGSAFTNLNMTSSDGDPGSATSEIVFRAQSGGSGLTSLPNATGLIFTPIPTIPMFVLSD